MLEEKQDRSLDSDSCESIILRKCLVFWEAVSWIAYRSLIHPGYSIGPRMLGALPLFGDEEGDEEDIGRNALAREILLNSAAKGKVRLCARGSWAGETEEKNFYKFPIQLLPAFVG